jgi:hypothetical protein
MQRRLIAVALTLTVALGLLLAALLIRPISAPHAVAIGLVTALGGYGEMSGSQVFPTNIRAEQLNTADLKSPFAGFSVVSDNVWLVSMDGVWIAGGFISNEQPVRHLTVVIDAEKGTIAGIIASP